MKAATVQHHKKAHEPRWPSLLNTLATLALFYSLPRELTPGPRWMLPLITAVLLLLEIAAERKEKVQLKFQLGVAMQAILTAAEAWAFVFLVHTLPGKQQPAEGLLQSTAAIWTSNILIFAAWYWRLDAGGPHRRSLRDRHSEGAFLFPQMALPAGSPLATSKWRPGFIDYLFLAFNTSVVFSPTDTPVLSSWAKVVMMVQGAISLGTIVILLARGISLL